MLIQLISVSILFCIFAAKTNQHFKQAYLLEYADRKASGERMKGIPKTYPAQNSLLIFVVLILAGALVVFLTTLAPIVGLLLSLAALVAFSIFTMRGTDMNDNQHHALKWLSFVFCYCLSYAISCLFAPRGEVGKYTIPAFLLSLLITFVFAVVWNRYCIAKSHAALHLDEEDEEEDEEEEDATDEDTDSDADDESATADSSDDGSTDDSDDESEAEEEPKRKKNRSRPSSDGPDWGEIIPNLIMVACLVMTAVTWFIVLT